MRNKKKRKKRRKVTKSSPHENPIREMFHKIMPETERSKQGEKEGVCVCGDKRRGKEKEHEKED